MNKDKGARYYPGADEEKILMDAMEKYKLAPLRSDERKQIREDTSRLLIEKGFKRWDPITVRTWFRNNENNAKSPIVGSENEMNQYQTIENQRSPMIQNYPVIYPFVAPQPMMAAMPQQFIAAPQPAQFMQPATFFQPAAFYPQQIMQPMQPQPRQMFQPMMNSSPNYFKKESPPNVEQTNNRNFEQQPTNKNIQIQPTNEEEDENPADDKNNPVVEQKQDIISDQQTNKPDLNENKKVVSFPSKKLSNQSSITFDTNNNSSDFFSTDSLFDMSPFSSRMQSSAFIQPMNEKQETNEGEKVDQPANNEEQQKTEQNETQNQVNSSLSTESSTQQQNEQQKTNQTEPLKSKVKFGFDSNDGVHNTIEDNDLKVKNNLDSSSSSSKIKTVESPVARPVPKSRTAHAPPFNLFRIPTPSPSDSDSDFTLPDSGNFVSRNDLSGNYDEIFGNWDNSKENEEEDLPNLPIISDDMTNIDYDNIKYDCYQKIQLCNRILRSSERKYNQQENEMENRLNFQKKMEERFVGLTNILHQKLGITRVFSYDRTVNDIKFTNHPGLKHQISRTTKLYNDAELSDSANSESKSFSSSSSSDIGRRFSSSGLPFSSSSLNKNTTKEEVKPMPTIYIPKSFIVPKNIDQKLKDFYYGKYKEGGRITKEINFVESSTFITFNPSLLKNVNEFETLKDDQEFDGIICEPAMTIFSNKTNTHVICYRKIEVNTGFFLPATSMTYNIYKTESGNEINIYVCGDKRVKEFTLSNTSSNSDNISGESSDKEEESRNETNGMTLINTDTFYIGDDFIQSSVMKIWKNELVLGYDSSLAFWEIKQKKSAYYSQNSPRRTSSSSLRTSINMNIAKRSGIDLQNVSWTKGKKSNKNRVEIKEMEQINCLEVIYQNKNEVENCKSFLAVASSQYPVIYIFNEEHQNISRLISHTMGISSLFSYGDNLFSGSCDMSIKLWDIKKGVTKLALNYHNDDVTSITAGIFMNKLFVFTGGKDNVIKCWCITDKRPLFEIRLDENYVPINMSFLINKNNDSATLKIVSYCIDDTSSDDVSLGATTYHKCQYLTYEF